MKRQYRSSNKAIREARTQAEWVRLYKRSPKAVPPAVTKTLVQRRLITLEVSNNVRE